MIVEKYDFVELVNDTEELSAKNIFKGIHGVLISYIDLADEWIVKFFDDNNYGVFAVAKVKSKDLKYIRPYFPHFLSELIEQINSPDFYSHTELKPPKFKEYDCVVLLNEKPQYVKEGLKKGDIGCVMCTHAIRNRWYVIFSDAETGDDIADLCVHEDDIELTE